MGLIIDYILHDTHDTQHLDVRSRIALVIYYFCIVIRIWTNTIDAELTWEKISNLKLRSYSSNENEIFLGYSIQSSDYVCLMIEICTSFMFRTCWDLLLTKNCVFLVLNLTIHLILLIPSISGKCICYFWNWSIIGLCCEHWCPSNCYYMCRGRVLCFDLLHFKITGKEL